MIFVAVQFQFLNQLAYLTVHTRIKKSLTADLFEQFLIMSLTVAHYGRQQIDPFSGILVLYELLNLFLGILHHRLTGQIGIGCSRPGIKQTQKIINLRSGSHRRTGILVRSFLLNGNHRTQPGNLVYIRTLHITQKIPGIGRKCFDITTLPFSKNRVESQRRLSAATHSGNHRQTVSGNLHINIFQVMHPGAEHLNLLCLLLHCIHHLILHPSFLLLRNIRSVH